MRVRMCVFTCTDDPADVTDTTTAEEHHHHHVLRKISRRVVVVVGVVGMG